VSVKVSDKTARKTCVLSNLRKKDKANGEKKGWKEEGNLAPGGIKRGLHCNWWKGTWGVWGRKVYYGTMTESKGNGSKKRE